MSYLVLARKWRPQTFDEILGQEAVTRTLKNAIVQDRVAHAFLFSGPRGVGKTSLARVLAKALNCLSFDGPTTTPCGTCSACVDITAGSAVDVLEIDGASNTSVDNIRELRETVRYLPSSYRSKIYIIDEVHMLSISAFNALLKTLEEPPPHVKFMFATTEVHKVPATILSRCQRYDFHRVGSQSLYEHLSRICSEEGIRLPEGVLRVISREAEGSVRDSLSLLDQVNSFGAEDLTEDEVLKILGVVDRTLVSEICSRVLESDAAGAIAALERVDEAGHDIKQLSRELLRWFRNLAVLKISREPERLLDLSESEISELSELAGSHKLETIERLFDQLAGLDDELARTGQPRLLLEMTLVKMAITPPLEPIADLIARLEEMEKGLRSGAAALAAGPEITDAPLFTGKPEPAAPEEATCADGDVTWEDFLAFVEKKDSKLFALLTAGTFAGRSGREWRVAFDPGSPLMERLKGARNAKRVQELMAECFGEGHRLIITEDSGLSNQKSTRSPYKEEEDKRREAMDDPVVQVLLDKLGGEIEEVKIK